jgi:hypothetical protein
LLSKSVTSGAGSTSASTTLTQRTLNELYADFHVFKQFPLQMSTFGQNRRVSS